MQSRSFFTFGVSFNILTDSVFVANFKVDGSTPIPVTATFLITEDDNNLITEGSNKLIAD
jgi:hypothetical protein